MDLRNKQINTWTMDYIHFNDDVPVIVTGEILSLDEDMIEVKTYPSNKIIYIDFEYKGIKDDLFIEKIVLRSSTRSCSIKRR